MSPATAGVILRNLIAFSDQGADVFNRVQHALRAFTPEDAKALKATVSTFPHSDYDLEELLTQLGTGEAVITVLSERGAPTPVAWTGCGRRSR